MLSHAALHSHQFERKLSGVLPPRYQGAAPTAAPMAAAALQYDAEGRVAWDVMWTDFCDLALAGGPPHRAGLLEPADPADVRSRPAEYAAVVDELARGIELVTGLPVVREGAPGWIGVACTDESDGRVAAACRRGRKRLRAAQRQPCCTCRPGPIFGWTTKFAM